MDFNQSDVLEKGFVINKPKHDLGSLQEQANLFSFFLFSNGTNNLKNVGDDKTVNVIKK